MGITNGNGNENKAKPGSRNGNGNEPWGMGGNGIIEVIPAHLDLLTTKI